MDVMRSYIYAACFVASGCSTAPVSPDSSTTSDDASPEATVDAGPPMLAGYAAFSQTAISPQNNLTSVYTLDLATPGAQPLKITAGPPHTLDDSAALDLDGRVVAWIRGQWSGGSGAPAEIWLADRDGANARKVYTCQISCTEAAFDASGRLFFRELDPDKNGRGFSIRTLDVVTGVAADWPASPSKCAIGIELSFDRKEIAIVTNPLGTNVCSTGAQQYTFVAPVTATTLPAPVSTKPANTSFIVDPPCLGPKHRFYEIKNGVLVSSNLDGSNERSETGAPILMKQPAQWGVLTFTIDGAFLLAHIHADDLQDPFYGTLAFVWRVGDPDWRPLDAIPMLEEIHPAIAWGP